MKSAYLASGFADVDRTDDRKAFADCLALLDSLPFYREAKRRSYELLKLETGLSVLDLGCGLGDDALRLAGRLGPAGRVVGLDASRTLLSAARRRAEERTTLLVEFVRADVMRLPFAAAAFDRCRIERTLQHVSDPSAAVCEMARVLKPGGIMLAYDNDWETFTVNSPDLRTTGILKELWRDSFRSGRVGSRLGDYFRAAGLNDVRIYSATSVMEDFDLADRLYNLRETARRAVERSLIAPAAGREWISGLLASSSRGDFTCSLTAYTAVGRRDGCKLANLLIC